MVTETSDYQRRAYNQSMAEHGVNWEWSPEVYRDLLKSNGGKDRLRLLSASTNQPLSDNLIQQVHARKTQLAGEMIVADKVPPRPGLVNLIREAKKGGAKVAWVTSTYPENTESLLTAAGSQLSADDFDHIFHREDVSAGKPSPEIYEVALRHFQVDASEAIAIEDSLISLLAAKGAGIFSVATLGEYHDEHLEHIADLVYPDLSRVSWSQLVKQYQR